MNFNRIMIMGAGAVGGYFGGRIAERTSCSVTMIARGDHLKAIRERGLEIVSPEGDSSIRVDAYEDPAAAGKQNLILFTVKSYDTEEAIDQVRPAVSEDTQILTIQNGIENYGKLRRAFGKQRVIRGLCRIGASITGPGVIKHNSMGSIVVGEADGSTSERLTALKEVFDETGIAFSISEDIRHEVWVKFAWNSIFNMLTGVAAVTVDKLFDTLESEQLCYDLFGEIRAVAASEGVSLTENDREKIIERSRRLKEFTTSTYNDRRKGKQLEYEAFTGAIIRLSKKYGIEVPRNETLYALLKVID